MRETWVQFLGWEDLLEEGHDNLLQYSCLENPTDREAWWAMVHGVQRVGHDCTTKHSTAQSQRMRDFPPPQPVFWSGCPQLPQPHHHPAACPLCCFSAPNSSWIFTLGEKKTQAWKSLNTNQMKGAGKNVFLCINHPGPCCAENLVNPHQSSYQESLPDFA